MRALPAITAALLMACASVPDVRPERTRAVLQTILPAGHKPPNVVLIVADDLGLGDLSVEGSRAIRTPHLDQMAAEGARLTQFYASAAECSPSRAGMLTGRYPIRTGIRMALLASGSFLRFGQGLLGMTAGGIPDDELLLPELLKARGYSTALIGKWHLGDEEQYLPNANGFDFFYGPLHSNDLSPFAIYRNRTVEEAHPADQATLTSRYTREAVQFVEAQADRPYFLEIAHTFPHQPLHASAEFRGKSKGGRYGDTVEELDASVGAVLEAIRKSRQDERTLVFFTSDNGPWFQGSAGATRGRKFEVFEGGFRVPLLARWPGTIAPGTVSAEPAMNTDLFATSLAVAGLAAPADRAVDGRDLMPLLKGSTAAVHDELIFFYRGQPWAIRQGPWKYHRHHEVAHINVYPWARRETQGPFLFRLDTDPDESYDLLPTNEVKANELAKRLDEIEAELKQNPRGWK